MLSGLQEILVIVVILLAILFIPRMMSPKRPPEPKPFRPLGKIKKLGVRWRLAIVVSLLWLMGSVVYCRPWREGVEPYLLYGLGPVIVGWCLTWVVAGKKSGKKN